METTLISLSAMLIGWFIGWFPNRQRTDHYEDMKTLTSQFANLSAQLISQINMNNSQPTFFPPPEAFQDTGEVKQEVDENFFDMLGGAT